MKTKKNKSKKSEAIKRCERETKRIQKIMSGTYIHF